MIVVDVEGTGVDCRKHSLVSVGAVSLHDPSLRFYEECQIWEGAQVSEGALTVNGFTEAEITDKNKQTEKALILSFLHWSQHFTDRTLAGQNVSYDRDMLKAAAERAGLSCDLAYRTIDTHTLCWMHMVKAGIAPPVDVECHRSALNLDAILQYCGIPEEPKPHNALTGALCHGEVISRLLYNRPFFPEFLDYKIPW